MDYLRCIIFKNNDINDSIFNECVSEELNKIQLDININKFAMSRNKLIKILEKENIYARRYFYPSLHNLEGFKYGEDFKNTDFLTKNLFQLPIGANVNISDIKKIISIIEFIHLNSKKINQIV